jgi:putative methyltransferase (TIGR04325 family)
MRSCGNSWDTCRPQASVAEQLRSGTPTYVWNGIYPSWDAACRATGEIGAESRGGERWLRRITQQLADYRSELGKFGIAMPPRPSSLPLVCAAHGTSAIVDFGGSSGWCWDYLQSSFPGNTVSAYVVVESEEVVAYMRNARLQQAPVSYVTIDDAPASCDLLYCNSVLQYFGSNTPLLSILARTGPGLVLLEDLAATGDEDFFSTQAFRGGAIPYRFLGMGKLLRELASLGYVESVRFPYASPVLGVAKPLEMDNFPPERRLRYTSSMLLARKAPR